MREQNRTLFDCRSYKTNEIVRVIWETCGKEPFIWKFVADKTDLGPGYLKRLSNAGIITSLGKAITHGTSNQILWKLSDETARTASHVFGPVDDDREEITRAMLERYRADMKQRYSKQGIREARIMGMKVCEEDRELIERIVRKYQFGSWSSRDLKRDMGLTIDSGTLRKWNGLGVIECTGYVKSRVKSWKVTETEILNRIRTNPVLKAAFA